MTRRVLAAAFLALTATVADGRAQERTNAPPPAVQGTGRIAGTVVGAATGRPVRLAEVSLTSNAGEFKATTDDAGGLSFEKLPAGSYTLQTRKPGFLDTRLLEGRTNVLWAAPPAVAARTIADRLERRHEVFYVYRRWSLLGLALHHVPRFVFKLIVPP